ncbi:uncharacterized protein LOC127715555 [Mytilus californianus]|uniref:uncharacterized protein LOC127715555 n=1 Tax=Mytilus californianus TaxID=6549 RepID=UPI00224673B7|nr:uncharacterized protein LOC127715555 [Mytilus californianus]
MGNKASSITSIVLFIFAGQITISKSEPCTNYVILEGQKEETRSPLLGSSGSAISDDRLITGWYRANLTAGTDMTRECPPFMRCGTTFPIWLNGNIPAVSDGEVVRSVCKLSVSDSCCDSSYNLTIKIKNCGDFRVYYLDTSGVPSSSAFCFGDIPKETTTSDQTVMASLGMSFLQSTAMPDFENTVSRSRKVEDKTSTLPVSVGVEMTTTAGFTSLLTSTDSTVTALTDNTGLEKITDSGVTSTHTNTTYNGESSVTIGTVANNDLATTRNTELTSTVTFTTLTWREIISPKASSTTMLSNSLSTKLTREENTSDVDDQTTESMTKSTENLLVTSEVNNIKTLPSSEHITSNSEGFNNKKVTTEEVHRSTDMTTLKPGSIQNDVSISTNMGLVIVVCVCVTLAVVCVIGMIVLCCLFRKRQNQRKSSMPWEKMKMDNIQKFDEIQQGQEYDYIDNINVRSYNDASFDSFRHVENCDESSSRNERYVKDPTQEKNERYVDDQNQESSYYHSMAENSSQKTSSKTYDYIETGTTENTELYQQMSSPTFDFAHYTNKEKIKEASSEKDFEEKYNNYKAVDATLKVETEDKLEASDKANNEYLLNNGSMVDDENQYILPSNKTNCTQQDNLDLALETEEITELQYQNVLTISQF